MRNALQRVSVVAAVLLAAALAGCSGDAGRSAPSQQQGVAEVLAEQTAAADGAEQESKAPASDFVGDTKPAYDEVDYDLTAMNADMVYATVFDMMQNPDAYVGKTVRMGGPYRHTYFEETQGDYYYVIVEDALACCSQGLEFIWGDGSHAWPADYPADDTEVVVCGRFESYLERGMTYIHLVDASLQAA